MGTDLPIEPAIVADAFRRQAVACRDLGSPFTATLLEVLVEDCGSGGALDRLLADWTLPPVPSALALRVAGGLNALVLDGAAPELAAFYPPDGTRDPADPEFRAVLGTALLRHADALRAMLARAVQTNEVQRSAVLLAGLATVAHRTQRDLALREIGASGGLNLLLDRWRMRLGDVETGPADAGVHLVPEWSGPAPAGLDAIHVHDRRAVDLHPLDLRDDAVVRRGLAFVWPDQPQRLANFRAAVAALRASDVRVETGDAADWLRTVLADPAPGPCTVVLHSIMWQYMPPATRVAVDAAIREAGARAKADAPLAWLRFEPLKRGERFELTLDLWDGASRPRERLAWVHPHGATVRWLGDDDPDRETVSAPD